VDDLFTVGVFNGLADLAEETQTLTRREVTSVAMLIKRLAFYVLHEEVGLPAIGRAAVKQARNIG
jgi:hypothetical protein